MLFIFLLACENKQPNWGYDLELLRIHSIKNADAYENILEFNQIIDNWNTIQGKNKANQFLLTLSSDYQLPISLEYSNNTQKLLSKDSLYLEIKNPLIPNQKIEIPVINFQTKHQKLEINATLIYFKKFRLNDFEKRKKQIIGKFLVIESDEKDFLEYIEGSKKTGILGLIFIMKEGNYVPCFEYHGDYKIPLLGLSQDDGFFLIESLKKYPRQFVKIFIHQNLEYHKTIFWKWEKNYGKKNNLYVLTTWKSNACNKALLSSVTPSFILMDLAKAFHRFDWNSHYNLIFIWYEDSAFRPHLKPSDICIDITHLTDFAGWYYPKSKKSIWKTIENSLKIYENRLILEPTENSIIRPKIPIEHQKIINTDSETIEWIHRDMILHSIGMVALTVYLLSVL